MRDTSYDENSPSPPQHATAKLNPHTTPEQFSASRQAQLAYRDALN